MTPANRFYEVIGSRILLFYDAKTKGTLEKAGYWHEDFSVKQPNDVLEKLNNYKELRSQQIKLFESFNFKKQLTDDFLAII